MRTPQNTSKKALLKRGWYVPTEVELAFLGLSANAHNVLILLKHFQGDREHLEVTQERIADLLNVSARTVERAIQELKTKGALTVTRGHRAKAGRYAAVYGRLTGGEVRILLGSWEPEVPDFVGSTDARTDSFVGSEPTDLSGHLPYIEEPTTRTNYCDAEASRTGAEMSWRQQADPDDELDPARLGTSPRRESAQGLPDGPEGLFPTEGLTRPVNARQAPARTQAQLDSPGSLALEFERMVRATGWAGPSPVNRAALAKHLSTWKRDGLTPDQIRLMMARFCEDPRMRDERYAPWQTFVYRRHRLLSVVQKTQQANEIEDARYASEEYWFGAGAGAR